MHIGISSIRIGGQKPNPGPQVLLLDEEGNAILDEETETYWATVTNEVDE